MVLFCIVCIENGNCCELVNELVIIDCNDFFCICEFIFDVDCVGVNCYCISVGIIIGEVSMVNNSCDIYVDVLEVWQKVFILVQVLYFDLMVLK